jgi:hypothetical protein
MADPLSLADFPALKKTMDYNNNIPNNNLPIIECVRIREEEEEEEEGKIIDNINNPNNEDIDEDYEDD